MRKKSFCGADECWDENDHSWLANNSTWRGEINGCFSSVFFIHGKNIREQRHIPYGCFPVSELSEFLKQWSEGLPNARLYYVEDTGGGNPGLWIEGEREPNNIDLQRLAEAREQMKEKALQDLRYILKQFPDLLPITNKLDD